MCALRRRSRAVPGRSAVAQRSRSRKVCRLANTAGAGVWQAPAIDPGPGDDLLQHRQRGAERGWCQPANRPTGQPANRPTGQPANRPIVLGHMLHGWGLERKKVLLQKAFDALPNGGAVLAYDAIIDDQRRENAFGLLFSLNMLIESREGAEYAAAECQSWMRDIGFSSTYVKPLAGSESVVVRIR